MPRYNQYFGAQYLAGYTYHISDILLGIRNGEESDDIIAGGKLAWLKEGDQLSKESFANIITRVLSFAY